jgi:deoxyribose-phosphate aldolase
MKNELDRIADIVAERVRARLSETQTSASPSTGGDGERAAGAPDLAAYIDHTLLAPDATRDQLTTLCQEAKQYGFASVCVNSSNVAYCAELLRGAEQMVCAVVGFPLGAMAVSAKAFETRDAVRAGADEIDMVINIAALKDANYTLVLDDIAQVVAAARPAKVKVILETTKLDDAEKVAGCTLAKVAGAHFVKTSTGFGGGGATVEDVALMRKVVGQDLGVKASGGVRDAAAARAMIAAGANRLGTSSSIAIVGGGKSEKSY